MRAADPLAVLPLAGCEREAPLPGGHPRPPSDARGGGRMKGTAAAGPAGNPSAPGTACRAERQVARASREGASPDPSPATCHSESGPVARRQGRCRDPGTCAWWGPGTSDCPRPTCRGGAVPERSRVETRACAALREKCRGRPSSRAGDVDKSQLTTGRY